MAVLARTDAGTFDEVTGMRKKAARSDAISEFLWDCGSAKHVAIPFMHVSAAQDCGSAKHVAIPFMHVRYCFLSQEAFT